MPTHSTICLPTPPHLPTQRIRGAYGNLEYPAQNDFSFNNIMHRQIDGVAMGSPLGPCLANIFVGFYESKLFQTTDKPPMYYRYVDDTFVIFHDEKHCDSFLSKLNSLHPALQFTHEKECNLTLPFLDVLVGKTESEFFTAVYRKPTFTGQYLRWNSFSPQKRKLNLILTLTHRALKICSPDKLQPELDKITSILRANGYPDDVIKSAIAKKLKQFQEPITSGPEKCPVYLRLQWLGSISTKFEKQVKAAVSNCFFAVEPRIIFETKELVPATKKDVLLAHQQSNVIYEYSCHCDGRYVGRTSQRLLDRINQHIPKSIRNANSILKRSLPSRACKSSTPNPTQTCDSAIGLHLLLNASCAKHYHQDRFRLLARGRSSFHLSVLESIFIKTSSPDLCRQKEFVYSLKIYR